MSFGIDGEKKLLQRVSVVQKWNTIRRTCKVRDIVLSRKQQQNEIAGQWQK